ncbi:MAG: HAD-superfamily hydrolase subfamily [Phenylobacterium sp.]|uniref:trehalose-phosphatase n=1 Tax=Phenylobacterium sp. TaxID=1871053 RepID=UPI0026340A61|nr:trehalose-phosphatase [Phenylobacterium sp.]MDB5428419.1 HAD-superfamily hydrolase subfamily [Phenylobacterium sp.]MDB5464854.1 HAD-superfamily hydrolase subfamily [Phenylobacterium sp.]MDB5496203.1 HAD-superfamily hydrolase subfamily [Phenylobacterium sp.]
MSIHDLTVGLPAPKPLRLSETALLLDLDGTLAPIAARPQDVRPDPRRTSLLERLVQKLDGRLAVVSGRTLADVDRILEGCVTPVAAVHGLVLRGPDGVVRETPPHPNLAKAAEGFRAFAARDTGLIVEQKGGLSVALHFRLASGQAEAARACARRLAAETGLVLQEGDMVEELRAPGASKGDSVRTFMAGPPFAGAMPVFVGDDATDEDGFAAAQALDGAGVRVGAPRPTAARCGLIGVEAALVWLEASS